MTPEERAFIREKIAAWRTELQKARNDLEEARKAGFTEVVAQYEETIRDQERRLAQASSVYGG
jgi:hypothetical protein